MMMEMMVLVPRMKMTPIVTSVKKTKMLLTMNIWMRTRMKKMV